jgi:hypothetical protein
VEALREELANTDDEVERVGLLAAIEEEAEYQSLRTSLGEDRILMLERLLDESEQDRAARLDNMNELDRLLRESERVRAAYELVVQRQAAQLLYVRYLRGVRTVLQRTKQAVGLPYQLVRRIGQALTRTDG